MKFLAIFIFFVGVALIVIGISVIRRESLVGRIKTSPVARAESLAATTFELGVYIAYIEMMKAQMAGEKIDHIEIRRRVVDRLKVEDDIDWVKHIPAERDRK